MKKIFLALLIFVSVPALSQDKFTPVIKQGSKLAYIIHTGGQDYDLFVSVDSVSPGYLKLGWDVSGVGSGGWIMKRNSLDKATNGFWSEPQVGSDAELPDDQNVLTFSKLQWESIQTDKKAIFDELTYLVKVPSEQQLLKIGGRIVDAILLESENGANRVWVLNNPSFPFVLKTEGNPKGIDLDLQSIN